VEGSDALNSTGCPGCAAHAAVQDEISVTTLRLSLSGSKDSRLLSGDNQGTCRSGAARPPKAPSAAQFLESLREVVHLQFLVGAFDMRVNGAGFQIVQ
jgi:hypothetical protein